jgi:hypothetical protein
MDNTDQIPELKDSGSDGSQVEAVSDFDFVEPKPMLGQTIAGLSSTNTRAFGGEVASAVLQVSIRQLELNLSESRYQNEKLHNENKELQTRVTDLRVNSSRLEERISAFRSIRHLRNFGIVVGTSALTISIQLFQSQKNSYGWLAVIVGVLLLLLSWFAAPKGGAK